MFDQYIPSYDLLPTCASPGNELGVGQNVQSLSAWGHAKAAQVAHRRGKLCDVANARIYMCAYVPGGRSENIGSPSQS
jgi:hypothetical protein